MKRFKVMLPEKYIFVQASSETEAKELALPQFFSEINPDDLIAWASPSRLDHDE